MEGVCANAARAWHPDNLPTLPVDGPRTFRPLRTLSVSRRRCLIDGKHACIAKHTHCAAAAAASRRARLGRKQCARGEALPLKSARDIRNHPCPLLPPLPLIDAVMQHTRFPIPCLSSIRSRGRGGARAAAVPISRPPLPVEHGVQRGDMEGPHPHHAAVTVTFETIEHIPTKRTGKFGTPEDCACAF